MTLNLPAAVEPFGTEWSDPGVYVLRYEKPDDLRERADRAFEHLPPWFEALEAAETVLYCGEAGDVMHRLEDHNNQTKRLTTLARMGCEPVGVINVIYHDSKEDAEHAEYNTAKRVARQTDDETITICNGEPV